MRNQTMKPKKEANKVSIVEILLRHRLAVGVVDDKEERPE
jgi:hypothetical protein